MPPPPLTPFVAAQCRFFGAAPAALVGSTAGSERATPRVPPFPLPRACPAATDFTPPFPFAGLRPRSAQHLATTTSGDASAGELVAQLPPHLARALVLTLAPPAAQPASVASIAVSAQPGSGPPPPSASAAAAVVAAAEDAPPALLVLPPLCALWWHTLATLVSHLQAGPPAGAGALDYLMVRVPPAAASQAVAGAPALVDPTTPRPVAVAFAPGGAGPELLGLAGADGDEEVDGGANGRESTWGSPLVLRQRYAVAGAAIGGGPTADAAKDEPVVIVARAPTLDEVPTLLRVTPAPAGCHSLSASLPRKVLSEAATVATASALQSSPGPRPQSSAVALTQGSAGGGLPASPTLLRAMPVRYPPHPHHPNPNAPDSPFFALRYRLLGRADTPAFGALVTAALGRLAAVLPPCVLMPAQTPPSPLVGVTPPAVHHALALGSLPPPPALAGVPTPPLLGLPGLGAVGVEGDITNRSGDGGGVEDNAAASAALLAWADGLGDARATMATATFGTDGHLTQQLAGSRVAIAKQAPGVAATMTDAGTYALGKLPAVEEPLSQRALPGSTRQSSRRGEISHAASPAATTAARPSVAVAGEALAKASIPPEVPVGEGRHEARSSLDASFLRDTGHGPPEAKKQRPHRGSSTRRRHSGEGHHSTHGSEMPHGSSDSHWHSRSRIHNTHHGDGSKHSAHHHHRDAIHVSAHHNDRHQSHHSRFHHSRHTSHHHRNSGARDRRPGDEVGNMRVVIPAQSSPHTHSRSHTPPHPRDAAGSADSVAAHPGRDNNTVHPHMRHANRAARPSPSPPPNHKPHAGAASSAPPIICPGHDASSALIDAPSGRRHDDEGSNSRKLSHNRSPPSTRQRAPTSSALSFTDGTTTAPPPAPRHTAEHADRPHTGSDAARSPSYARARRGRGDSGEDVGSCRLIDRVGLADSAASASNGSDGRNRSPPSDLQRWRAKSARADTPDSPSEEKVGPEDTVPAGDDSASNYGANGGGDDSRTDTGSVGAASEADGAAPIGIAVDVDGALSAPSGAGKAVVQKDESAWAGAHAGAAQPLIECEAEEGTSAGPGEGGGEDETSSIEDEGERNVHVHDVDNSADGDGEEDAAEGDVVNGSGRATSKGKSGEEESSGIGDEEDGELDVNRL